MERIFNIPTKDENLHLYLGYLGLHGQYAVMDVIKRWKNEGSHENEVKNFIEANKDNKEVMEYIY